MSAILAVIGDNIDNLSNKKKLMQVRCGVLGELYGSANETRFALDLPQVVEWIMNNGPKPKTIYDANFSPRLHTLGLEIVLLIKEFMLCLWLTIPKIGYRPQKSILTYFSESIDIHHIFLWLGAKTWHQKR